MLHTHPFRFNYFILKESAVSFLSLAGTASLERVFSAAGLLQLGRARLGPDSLKKEIYTRWNLLQLDGPKKRVRQDDWVESEEESEAVEVKEEEVSD